MAEVIIQPLAGYFNTLNHDPPFIVREISVGQYIIDQLPHTPVIHWVLIPYYLSTISKVLNDARLFKTKRPADEIYYFCHEIETYTELKHNGLRLVDAPLEVMMDIDYFHVDKTIKKKRDALMVARAEECKRIELARNIEDVLIITRVSNEEHQPYYDTIAPILGDKLSLTHVNKAQLNTIYNESRVGLCLSSAEGAQRAVLEHQLAGNPIVCTISRGGKYRFINTETSLIVPPDPDVIAKSVQYLIRRNHTPEQVREAIWLQLIQYRRRIIDLGESIINRYGLYNFEQSIQPTIKSNFALIRYSDDILADVKELIVD